MVEYYNVEWQKNSEVIIFEKQTLKDTIDLIVKHDYDKIIIVVWK